MTPSMKYLEARCSDVRITDTYQCICNHYHHHHQSFAPIVLGSTTWFLFPHSNRSWAWSSGRLHLLRSIFITSIHVLFGLPLFLHWTSTCMEQLFHLCPLWPTPLSLHWTSTCMAQFLVTGFKVGFQKKKKKRKINWFLGLDGFLGGLNCADVFPFHHELNCIFQWLRVPLLQ